MEEEEIVKMEKLLNSKNEAAKKEFERLNRLESINEFVSSPKGIIRKKCPVCNRILVRKITHTKFGYIFKTFTCDCGYEYVERPYKGSIQLDPCSIK